MNWIIENYQLVAAGLSGIFGAGAVVGSIRGRLKGVETQIKNLDERVDGIYQTTGRIEAVVEKLAARPSSGGNLWRNHR